MSPVLVTPRLRLRPLAGSDEALYVRLYGDTATMRHVGAAMTPATARRSFAAACRDQVAEPATRPLWVLERAVDAVAIGLLGLHLGAARAAEVGVLIFPEHQARGYASEAIDTVADFAFARLGLLRLHARHATGHDLAAGLMASLGFVRAPDADDGHPVRWERLARHGRPRQ